MFLTVLTHLLSMLWPFFHTRLIGIKTKRKVGCLCGLSLSFSVESRGIWQLPSTLWHLPLPCAPGMLGCLHYWHTGQQCGDERGLAGVERLSENTYTSRLALQHCLSLSVSLRENFFSAQAAELRQEEERPTESTFRSDLGKKRESQNKDKRHNHQEELSAWRRKAEQQSPTSW